MLHEELSSVYWLFDLIARCVFGVKLSQTHLIQLMCWETLFMKHEFINKVSSYLQTKGKLLLKTLDV